MENKKMEKIMEIATWICVVLSLLGVILEVSSWPKTRKVSTFQHVRFIAIPKEFEKIVTPEYAYRVEGVYLGANEEFRLTFDNGRYWWIDSKWFTNVPPEEIEWRLDQNIMRNYRQETYIKTMLVSGTAVTPSPK